MGLQVLKDCINVVSFKAPVQLSDNLGLKPCYSIYHLCNVKIRLIR